MKKKILMYIYYYFPFESTITNAMISIIEALSDNYEIDIYTIGKKRLMAPKFERQGKLKIFRYREISNIEKKILEIYNYNPMGVQKPFILLKRIILLAFQRIIKKEKLYSLINASSAIGLEKVLSKGGYDILITVSSPFQVQLDALELEDKGFMKSKQLKWFAYCLDPYSTFIRHSEHFDWYLEREKLLFSRVHAIFTTPELYEDNKKSPLSEFSYKTYAVPLANLREIKKTVPINYLKQGKINCVYVGRLTDTNVRNPEYFYKLARECGEDFEFHIVCWASNETNDSLREQYVDGKTNIHWYNRKSLAECHSLMCDADIMINIGNICTNQTPSKIFDYIGVGKPIINFCAIKEDTSKKYLDKYPLVLNIFDKQELDKKDVKDFVSFCRANCGKTLDYSEIKNLYIDYTAGSVANNFLKTFGWLLTEC